MPEEPLDIDKISEETHISVINLNSLFNKEFDKLNSIKVCSFISIIQRETGYDLGEIKKEAEDYYNKTNEAHSVLMKEYTHTKPKRKKSKILKSVLAVVVLLVGVAAYFIFNISQNLLEENSYAKENSISVESPTIAINNIDSKDDIIDDIEDKTNISESNVEVVEEKKIEEITAEQSDVKSIEDKTVVADQVQEVIEEVVEEVPEPIIEKSIKIVSKKDVWTGVTYLDNLKYKDITAKEIILDPNRDFIAVFGHNHIEIVTHKEILTYEGKERYRRISYIDGVVQIISQKRFKAIIKEYKSQSNM